MNKIRKFIFIFILIYISLKIFDFITSPQIEIINHTNIPIRFKSLQYLDTGQEPTTKELDDWKLNYKIGKSKSKTMQLYIKHRFEDKNIYFGIDYLYFGDYLTDENIDDLAGVTFTSKPAFIGQSAHCSFEVEVYTNKKTIVTPTRKWGCINPMYYHNSLLKEN